MNTGFKSTAFWVHLVAHFAPILAAYFMNVFAPGNPIAAASVAVVSSIAGQYGASQFSDDQTTLHVALASVPPPVAAVVTAVAAAIEHS